MLDKITTGKYKKLSIITTVSSIIGISLLLLSIQLYCDWQIINKGNEAYVIINKPVNILSTLGFTAGFEKQEIEDIKNQSFINRVGSFNTNDFSVSIGSNNLGFRTEAFFESVPSEFIDIEIPKWNYYQEGEIIPIILSADYLALYNFGFAPSQGLPQFTPNAINKVSLDVSIRSNNGYGNYKGKIVGFSKRINSIIVPEKFLEFANKKYGSGNNKLTSRLILEVKNPRAANFISFAKEKGYEINTNKAFGDEISKLVQKSILLILFIGLLVLILTLMVFYLSYKLIIEERIETIRILFTQGYQPITLAKYFIRYASLLIFIIIIFSIIIVQLFHVFLAQQIDQIGFDINTWLSFPTWIFSVFLIISLYATFKTVINKTMNSKYQ